MIRVMNIITALVYGGAQQMLYNMCRYFDRDKFYHEIMVLKDKGPMGKSFEDMGIKVHYLNLGLNLPFSVMKARKLAKDFDIVNTWLYHSDLFGFFIKRKALIWNIRHGELGKDLNKRGTLRVVGINSYLSGHIDLITYNSQKARDNHIKAGYCQDRDAMFYNGFDLDRFRYMEDKRKIYRKEMGIGDETVIITLGRWNVQKGYHILFQGLERLKGHIPFKMIMAGDGLCENNHELMDLIKNRGLDNIILLGIRNDIPELLSMADIYISSSLGESFSNAIGEAMACELPCISTDAGESENIIGDTGIIVRKGDGKALADGIMKMVSEKGDHGKRARERIRAKFEIRNIIREYEDLLCRIG